MKKLFVHPLRHTLLVLAAGLALSITSCRDKYVAAPLDPVSQQDRDFVAKTAYLTIAEIEMNRLAALRSDDSTLRVFAAAMATSHESLHSELREVANDKHISLPDSMDASQKLRFQQLSALSGMEFNRYFLSSGLLDHQALQAELEKEITIGTNADLKEYARSNETLVDALTGVFQQLFDLF